MNETIEKLMAEIDRCELEKIKAFVTYAEYVARIKGLHILLLNEQKQERDE